METNNDQRYVHFIYQAATGIRSDVEGRFTLPLMPEGIGTTEFMIESMVCGDTPESSPPETEKHFAVSFALEHYLPGEIEAGQVGHEFANYREALRRFAVAVTRNDLDTDAFNSEPFPLKRDDLERLRPYLDRECKYQSRNELGDLVCVADSSRQGATTLAICERCPMPDPWELCENVAHVTTKSIETDQAGLIDRRLTGAQCQIGNKPKEKGGIPDQCRAGVAECFQPRTEPSQKERKGSRYGFPTPGE